MFKNNFDYSWSKNYKEAELTFFRIVYETV